MKIIVNFPRFNMSVLTQELIKKYGKSYEADIIVRLFIQNQGLMNIQNVSTLQNLFYLNISNNQISDISPALNLPNIQIIIADNNQVAQINCNGNNSLIYLSMKNNKLTSQTSIAQLAKCTKLLSLNVLNNPLEKQQDVLKYILDFIPQIHTFNHIRIKLTNGEIISEITPKQQNEEIQTYEFPVCDWVDQFPDLEVQDWDAEMGDLEKGLKNSIQQYWAESKQKQE